MSRDLREFVPYWGRSKGWRCMSVGPTVSNFISHGRGNLARSTVSLWYHSSLFRIPWLRSCLYFQLTDADDKIINRAKEEGITPLEVVDKYIAAFREDVTALGVKPATRHPRVVEFMADIIRLSLTWLKRLCLRESRRCLLRVEKSTTMLSWPIKPLEDLELGASGLNEERRCKENPVDLALWKLQNQARFLGTVLGDLVVRVGILNVQSCRQRFWEIPLISTVVGADLEFPHHTNEIAQSEAKQARLLLTTGCIMVLSISTMSRCPSPWATL